MFGFGKGDTSQCIPVMKETQDRWSRDKEKDVQEAIKLWIEFERKLADLNPVAEDIISSMLRGKLNQRY